MTLQIKLNKVRLRLWLPAFAVGGIALSYAKKKLEKSVGFSLQKSRKLKRDIIRAVKQAKKQVGPFELLNVSADGINVVIKI